MQRKLAEAEVLQRFFWAILTGVLCGASLLSGCAGAPDPPLTASLTPIAQVVDGATTESPESGQTVPAYPYLLQTNDPSAGAAGQMIYPTPGAAIGVPVPTVTIPYPAPGESLAGAPDQTENPASVATSPYPVPGGGDAGQASAVATPTREVRRSLLASDPGRFQQASGKIQLVEFFAFWDGLSKALAAMIHGLESEYGGRINFVYLDIDDPANERLKQQLGYKLQPEFFLLDGRGNLLEHWTGAVTESELRSAIEAALR